MMIGRDSRTSSLFQLGLRPAPVCRESCPTVLWCTRVIYSGHRFQLELLRQRAAEPQLEPLNSTELPGSLSQASCQRFEINRARTHRDAASVPTAPGGPGVPRWSSSY
eukprot:1017174-Rhodomonas_salina.1